MFSLFVWPTIVACNTSLLWQGMKTKILTGPVKISSLVVMLFTYRVLVLYELRTQRREVQVFGSYCESIIVSW